MSTLRAGSEKCKFDSGDYVIVHEMFSQVTLQVQELVSQLGHHHIGLNLPAGSSSESNVPFSLQPMSA